jgi:ARG and Rhodanese-Phosphatase-superfamily-associated Protein domain
VRKQQTALAVSSGTSALADSYETYKQNLAEAEKSLQYLPGACGLVVAIGPHIATADLFDKPATCEKVWGRLLSGLVLDALTEGQTNGSPDVAQVGQLLGEVRSAAWMQTPAAGEGQEYRAEFSGKAGSALLLDGELVHGSVVAGL